jgi:uncharacterized repeat protein (TIGR01451 family)
LLLVWVGASVVSPAPAVAQAGLPTLASPTSAVIRGASATIGATVLSEGDSAVTERGVVFAETDANPAPAIGGTGVTRLLSGSGAGVFAVPAAGLLPDRSYSFRGYAINGTGTAYSAAATFRTLAPVGLSVSSSPGDTGAGETLTPALVARLVDSAGETVTGATARVRASLGAHPGASTLTGTTVVTTTAGVATFGPLSLTQAGTGYTFGISDDQPATTFTARTAPGLSSLWQSVTHGSGGYVAVAGSGTPRVMRSVDGRAWTGVTDGVPASGWTSVTFGNGLYVAVASSGTTRIMTSTNGVTWTGGTIESVELRSVTYGAGMFVAVASSGARRVMTSPDGLTWTGRVVPSASWQAVAYGGGRFVAVASSGSDPVMTSTVMTSTDGITWTAQMAPNTSTWTSVAYGAGVFVAVSVGGDDQLMTSPDGVAWTVRAAVHTDEWRSVAYGAGTFVAVSSNGSPRAMTSVDGLTWSATDFTEDSQWQSVTAGGGQFVAVASMSSGANRVMTSSAFETVSAPMFSVVAGAPSRLTVSTTPVAGASGAVMPTVPVVRIEDMYGNLTSSTASVTVAVSGGAGGFLEGSGSVAAAGGVATFTGLRLHGLVGQSYSLTFSLAGVTSATVTGLQVTGPGVSSKLTVDTAPVAGASGSVLTTVPVVAIEDAAGNRTADAVTVTASITAGSGGAVSGGTTASTNGGVATFTTLRLSGVIGTDYTLGFSAPGLVTTSAGPVRIASPGEPATLVFTVPPADVTASQTFPAAVEVVVIDASGNLTVGVTTPVRAHAERLGEDAVLTGERTRTTAAGKSTFADLAVPRAGTDYRLQMTDATAVLSWSTFSAGASAVWAGVAYGAGRFVAVSDEGGMPMIGSTDGRTWSPLAAPVGQWSSVTFGAGRFVAVARGGSARIATSTDGVTWQTVDSPATTAWRSVAYGRHRFVAVGDGVAGVMTSPDGLTWTLSEAPLGSWRTVAYGAGRFVAAGDAVMVSTDGTSWTLSTPGAGVVLGDLAYGDGWFVAVTEQGGGAVRASADGVTWTAATVTGLASARSLSFSNGRFLLSGATPTGGLWSSVDGSAWVAQPSLAGGQWGKATYGAGMFVVLPGTASAAVAAAPVLAAVSSVAFEVRATLPTLEPVTGEWRADGRAIFSSRVTNDGGLDVTERGVVVGPSDATLSPTLDSSRVTRIVSEPTNPFSVSLPGLTPSAAYRMRAYAVTPFGVGYSDATNLPQLSSSAQDALAQISGYQNGDPPATTLYELLGVTGVDETLVPALGSALLSLPTDRRDTVTEIQAVVDAYRAIMAEANGGADDPNPGSDPTAETYARIGAHEAGALSGAALGLLNDVVGTLTPGEVSTVATLDALAVAAARVTATVAGLTVTPPLTSDDLVRLGLNLGRLGDPRTGPSAGGGYGVGTGQMWRALTAALVTQPDDGSGTDSQAELQQVVNSVLGSWSDVALSLEMSPAQVAIGRRVRVVLTARGRGPGVATNVVLQWMLPAGLTIETILASAGEVTAATGRWRLDRLATDEAATLTIEATVTVPGAMDVVALRASQSPTDPEPMNDVAWARLNGATVTDVAVAMAADRPSAAVGEAVTFTVQVRNVGTTVATDVAIDEAVTAALGVGTMTATLGTVTGRRWTIARLEAGQTATLTIARPVNSTGAFVHAVQVSGVTESDGRALNNRAAVLVNGPPGTNLRVEAQAMRPEVGVFDQAPFLVAVTNDGHLDATNIVLSTTVSGLSLTSAVPTHGTMGAPDLAPDTVLSADAARRDATASRWRIPTLRPRETASLRLTGQVTSAGQIGIAAALLGLSEGDLFGTDDTARALSSVPVPESTSCTDLSLTRSAVGPVTRGGLFDVRYTATNLGPGYADGVSMVGTTPTGLSIVSATANAGGVCTVSSADLVCGWATPLLVGVSQARTVDVVYRAADSVSPGSLLTGSMVVGSGANECSSENNRVDLRVVVDAPTRVDFESQARAVSVTSAATDVAVPLGTRMTVALGVANRSTVHSAIGEYELTVSDINQIVVEQIVVRSGSVVIVAANRAQWSTGLVAPGGATSVDVTFRMVSPTSVEFRVVRMGGSLVDPEPTNDTVSLVVDGVSQAPGGGRWVAAGNIDGVAGAEVITGTDAGDLPQVRAFSGNGADLGIRFLAFDRTFRGGVRVAACDVDADGTDEVIVGQGTGGSRIRVLRVNGSSVAEMAAGLPFEASFTGGVFLSCADLDRDGRAEIVVGAGVGRQADVKLFSVNGSQLVALGTWTAYPSFTGGVRVSTGHHPGSPLVGPFQVMTSPGPGLQSMVRVWSIANWQASLVAQADVLPGSTRGLSTALGDVDNDGVLDVLLMPDVPSIDGLLRTVSLSDGQTFNDVRAGAGGFSGAIRMAVATLSQGTGVPEVIVTGGSGSMPVLQVYLLQRDGAAVQRVNRLVIEVP